MREERCLFKQILDNRADRNSFPLGEQVNFKKQMLDVPTSAKMRYEMEEQCLPDMREQVEIF